MKQCIIILSSKINIWKLKIREKTFSICNQILSHTIIGLKKSGSLRLSYLFGDFGQKQQPFLLKLCQQSFCHHMNITSLIIIFHGILENQPDIRTYLPNILISSAILSLHLILNSTEIHRLINDLACIIYARSIKGILQTIIRKLVQNNATRWANIM